MRLLDKRVLVTGGSRGIGAAIARTLARYGADVAISYERSADRAQEVVRDIENEKRRGVAFQAEGADPEANEKLVEQAVRSLGGLDILINNAGTIRHGNLTDLSPDDINDLLHINIRGTVLTTRADYLRSLVPLGRYGTSDEVAATVAFLAGPDSSFITGSVITIDGGMNA